MANQEVRIDVEVNTQDAKAQLREIAEETDRINSQVNAAASQSTAQSPDRHRIPINSIDAGERQDMSDYIELLRLRSSEREKEINKEFKGLRKENVKEFEADYEKHKAGKITDEEYRISKENFRESQISSFEDERRELVENTRVTNELIQELLDRYDNAANESTEEQQLDNSEFSKSDSDRSKGNCDNPCKDRIGVSGDGGNKTQSDDDDDNKKSSSGSVSSSGGGSYNDDDDDAIRKKITKSGRVATSVLNEDITSAATGILGMLGPWGITAAVLAAATGAGINLANKRDIAESELISYRAVGDADVIGQSIRDTDFARYNYKTDEYVKKRKELLLASGRYQGGSDDNTLEAIRLERGYGIESVADLSKFERQDKYDKSTADNIYEMLNVLTSIKNSSITVDDLVLANEKTKTMYSIESDIVSRQENFDKNNVIGLMAAFEKLGGEGQDQREADFIKGTLNAMRDGGSKNMMLLKNQFAINAHPELANDPAALSRMIEEGTDSEYITSSLKGLKNLGGDNDTNEYFLYKEYFKQLTPSMREKLIGASSNEEILANIRGQGLDNLGNLNSKDADTYAHFKTQLTDEGLKDVNKTISNLANSVKKFFANVTDNGIPVTLRKQDLNKVSKTNTITGN